MADKFMDRVLSRMTGWPVVGGMADRALEQHGVHDASLNHGAASFKHYIKDVEGGADMKTAWDNHRARMGTLSPSESIPHTSQHQAKAWEMPGLDPDNWMVAGERYDRDPKQTELPIPPISREQAREYPPGLAPTNETEVRAAARLEVKDYDSPWRDMVRQGQALQQTQKAPEIKQTNQQKP